MAGQPNANYIGKGLITPNMIKTPSALKDKMISLGIEENVADFIIATSYPKGHSNKLSVAEATRQYFPDKPSGTAVLAAFNALTEINGYSGLLCTLLHGQEAADLKAEAERIAKEEAERPKRPHRPVEVRAKEQAEKMLNQQFREKHNLAKRGRMRPENQEKWEAFLEKNIEKATEKVLKDKGYEVESV